MSVIYSSSIKKSSNYNKPHRPIPSHPTPSTSTSTGPQSFAPSFLPLHLPTASTPAFATSSSCPGVPVLTPIAPTTTPSTSIGTPPPIKLNLPPLELWIPYAGPPGWKFLAAGELVYVEVGMRWPAAVKALSMAMETEVSFARGMRVKCRR